MKTIAIVFASICFVTAAFAEDSCKIQATGKNLRRRAEELRHEVLQGPGDGAEAAWRSGDELHQEMRV